jgi:hypothetical protein
MTSVTARHARVKILLFTFTGPVHGSRVDCDRTIGRSALFRAGLAIRNHHSVHPSSLSPFPLSQLLCEGFLVTTTHKDGGSLG